MIDYLSYPWDTGKQLCYQPNIFLNNQQFFYDIRDTYRASSGKLVVSVYEMNTDKPIKGATVFVRKQDEGSQIITTLQTNDIGLTSVVSLPAPPKQSASDPSGPKPYSEYILTIEAPNYGVKIVRGVQIFAGTTAKQRVEMIPINRTGERQLIETINIPQHALTEYYLERQLRSNYPRFSHFPQYANSLNIPQYIIVHDGNPNELAPRYKVDFKEYIKNVSASELYPNWPKEALKANVICITSFVLNRIYKEHYFERGFTISSSSWFDQSFNYGRNTFLEIDDVVDEIFNQYITRPYSIEPLLINYCSGIRDDTNEYFCRWGSIYLADQGMDYVGILKSYYPFAQIYFL
ncbi:SpoIID/LytB domain-containing protein [Bacillus thuringiensis]|uniref:SpoIID/LytB domain-containing protein n=1 Tax=Bacillus thuringiensis TaxID=1428 RepID=UPI000BF4E6AA|nr:SpoIID/LytB domain-containing protein [Bacillus thuringiensis]MED3057135.1 SpoIID/LytB domain-containing protein [Bacillus thuringiensis]PFH67020.1 peptidoglycan-binding protein [Bacillus thuringiensis]